MTPQQYQRVKALFARALELPSAERAGWLAREAADDADVRREVLEMLAEERNPRSAARQLDAGAARMLDDSSAMPERIGRYRILGVKGRGGMGIVYEAEQESPKRRVALKVIKSPMVSAQLLARFQREAEALGKLQHVGIAHIYEAATARAESGEQPYLAMELIQGERITAYAKKHELSVRQRLELVARVCDAVQHAHQRGIIHRDLKPANILVVEPDTSVTSHVKSTSRIADTVGQPKILDFGVARLTAGDVNVATLQTEVGQLIGTLAYMSPEQVAGDSTSLDTRCDIYALGVVLFEVLSGQLPHNLGNGSIAQAARMIQEVDPTRLSEINAELRGDLDTIVAKALEKDRAHRYQSASELAADLRRYLADEPIVARPASATYQLRKFARRHKGLVAGLGVACAVLLLGAAGTAIGLVSALRANKELAKSNRELAQTNIDLRNVSAFQSAQLTDIDVGSMGLRLRADLLSAIPDEQRKAFETQLGAVNFVDYARSTLDHNIFRRAIDTINVQFASQPVLQATLLQDLATAMGELGLYRLAQIPQDRALYLRRRQLGNDHDDTIASIAAAGVLARNRSDFEHADALLREALERIRRLHGKESKEAYVAMSSVAANLKSQGKLDEAVDLAHQAVKGLSRISDANDIESINALANLAGVLFGKGEYDEAIGIGRQVLDAYRKLFGADSPKTLKAMTHLGDFLEAAGQYEESTSLIRQAYDQERRVLGADHPDTVSAMMELGNRLSRQGKYAQAEPLLRGALGKLRRLLGNDHYNTLNAIDYLASLLEDAGRFDEAKALFAESLERRRRTLGEDHPATLRSLGNYAYFVAAEGGRAEAEPLYRQTLAGMRRVYGDDHPHTLTAMGNLASLLSGMGRDDEAEPLYRETLAADRRTLGNDHPSTLNAVYNLGDMLLRQGKLDEAEPLCREALDGYERVGGDDHIGTLYSLTLMGRLLAAEDKPVEAQPYFQQAVERRRRVNGDDHPQTLAAVYGLVDALEVQDEWVDAEKWRRFALDFVVRNHPDDATNHGGALCALGRNLLRQGRPADAEAPLTEGLALYQDTDESDSWQRWDAQSLLGEAISADADRRAQAEALLLEAADHMAALAADDASLTSRVDALRSTLAGLYEAWHQPDQAEKWRSAVSAVN
ncbi:MAG: serine/threonine protein kinase [Phycisphaerales bacterium]|nr:serine/threonine protein kinase [Phycisphaerales bacterium]